MKQSETDPSPSRTSILPDPAFWKIGAVYLGRLRLRFTPADVCGDVFSADALQLRRGWVFELPAAPAAVSYVRISERLLTWPTGQSEQPADCMSG